MSYYRNKYDPTGSASEQGRKAEVGLKEISESKGYYFKSSSEYDNIERHIDCYLTKGDTTWSVEVKSQKAERKGGEVQDEFVWLEHTNVKGKKGWIFGESKYTAFEQSDCFVFVPTEELPQVWNEIVDTTIYAKRADQAHGTLWTRPKRKDVISMVKMADLKKRPGVFIWEKKKDV